MNKKLSLLMIEDSEDDALLVLLELKRHGYDPDHEVVDSEEEFLRALDSNSWDAILSDYNLPRFNALHALKTVKQRDLDIPFIIVSGTIGEELAVSLMKSGAHDYIMKNNLVRLVPALEREIQEASVRRERRKSEASLIQQEALLRTVLESMPIGVWLTDNMGNIQMVNPAGKQIWDGAEYVGKDDYGVYKAWWASNGKRIKSDEWAAVKALVNGEISLNEEIIIETFSGKKKIILNSAMPYFDSKNQISGVIIVNQDISEVKRSQRTIQESELKYRTIFELAADAIIIILPDGTIIDLNIAAMDMLGYSSKEELQEAFNGKLLDSSLMMNSMKALRQNGVNSGKFYFETTWKRNNGELINVSVTGKAILLEEHIQFQLIARDITSIKKREEELRKFSRAVEQTSAHIMITDINGIIEYVNPKFSEITGYSLDEIRGKKPSLLKSNLTPIDTYQKLWQTIISGGEWKGEFLNRKKNGELYWESDSISAITNEKGEITHFIAVNEDITDRKLFEEELKKAKEKAEEADKLKSEFLAQISHEIRTPVNSMLSFTGLLQDELEEKVNEDLRTSFHIIQSAGKRLIRTVDMLLNMSEVHTGAYEYQPREIDLYSDILERIFNEYYNIAKNKSLEFLIENKVSDTKLVADEYSVYQIFNNLVDNAIKYTNKGKITCCIKRDNNNRLKVEVQDTGIGISKEYLPNIFLPFSQEEQGYTRKFEGNGLGMALVKSYCDINNADIAVESEKDRGTVFTVTFPEQAE